MAQTVVYPFDVIRRRSQTHTGPGKAYKSVYGAFSTIAREEGIRCVVRAQVWISQGCFSGQSDEAICVCGTYANTAFDFLLKFDVD